MAERGMVVSDECTNVGVVLVITHTRQDHKGELYVRCRNTNQTMLPKSKIPSFQACRELSSRATTLKASRDISGGGSGITEVAPMNSEHLN